MATKTAKATKPTKATKSAVETKAVKAVKEPKKAVSAPKAEKEAPAVKAKKVSTATFDLQNAEKATIIESFAQKTGDTGSPEVQVALLSHKIVKLIDHLNLNKKDNHSRRGLLKVVAKRRRILTYLQGLDASRYGELIAKLGLKK